jgi:biopolymer transport protein ExbB
MDGLVDILAGGGPVIAVLIVLSVISLALIAHKLMQLRGVLAGKDRRRQALETWAEGDRTDALAALETGPTPADRLLRHAMSGLAAGLPAKALNDDLEWRGNAEIAELSRNIRLLELIAMISPLLGLLGTVLGMIRSFQELALAQGAANASLLAGGIWEALLTTAAGLIVAIPAAVAASMLATRVDRVGQEMEAAIGQLFAIESSRAA